MPLIKEGNLIHLLLFWKFCFNMFVITRHFQYQSFGYVQMSCLKTMQNYDFYWCIICLWWYAGSNFPMSCKRWIFFSYWLKIKTDMQMMSKRYVKLHHWSKFSLKQSFFLNLQLQPRDEIEHFTSFSFSIEICFHI